MVSRRCRIHSVDVVFFVWVCPYGEGGVMNIVYGCDDNFAEIMGVSICSVFENCRGISDLTCYVLENGITLQNRKKLSSLALLYHRDIVFVDIQKQKFGLDGIATDRGSVSQFARLFISQLLPISCERILYLDCDTIVRHPLDSLYETSFDGKVACGVMDCLSREHRRMLGLAPDELYINSGVMLIDLKAWRQNEVDSKIFQIIERFHGNIPYADQGLLNLALRGKIKELHPRFNCTQIYTTFQFDELMTYRKPSLRPSKQDLMEAVENPSIVHFTTLFCASRPWQQNARGPFFDDWKHYKSISPWNDSSERLDKRKGFLKWGEFIFRILPKKVSLPIFGFLHARIKPKFM